MNDASAEYDRADYRELARRLYRNSGVDLDTATIHDLIDAAIAAGAWASLWYSGQWDPLYRVACGVRLPTDASEREAYALGRRLFGRSARERTRGARLAILIHEIYSARRAREDA